ncbi:synaptopodin 2-like protein [Microcaecilia unicolor]|uniref:Synaptopodin 2-like protein n=1 Tax=Microcaecilia unicolor TaxID=1415580 RepID=A0A6P7Y8Y0_9AMPH|nr:synaptopodin 2-like protein [Microcaecilia unicolor]
MVMGADDKVLITLSGEGPWGFRLHGGSEKNLPLQVSKIRKRSKACRSGLWENDELVSINGKPCSGLSHAEAMQIIDSSGGHLQMWVKRSIVRDGSSPSPGGQRQLRVLQSTSSPNPGQDPRSPEPPPRLRHRGSLTSPPDSEAYYGETDSDADIRASISANQQQPPELTPAQLPSEKHRRTRKKSPRSPPSAEPPQQPQFLSEMSSHNSVPDPEGTSAQVPWRTGSGTGGTGEGVAKREISRAETPFSDPEMSAEPEPEAEPSSPSPEALLLPHGIKNIKAERHLIPMVGPVEHPVDEDLTTTYTEKAKQAKLHRSESMQEKQVKEAKTKCRTIASLLTDAPNPHSKGVLMFKKRRQRAKKYTLVSYGSVDEDRYNEDEDGIFPTSESEFDEEGFSDARSLTNHSDLENTYLDIEKPKTEPVQQHQDEQSLSESSGKGAQLFGLQRQKAIQHSMEQILLQKPEEKQPHFGVPVKHSMVNGEEPIQQSISKTKDEHSEGLKAPGLMRTSTPSQLQTSMVEVESTQAPTGVADIFNRSAKPFTPGVVGQRPATTSVIFRPSVPKKTREIPSTPSIFPPPFSLTSPGIYSPPINPQVAPTSSVASLFLPAPGKPAAASTPQPSGEDRAPTPISITPKTTTASIYLSTPPQPTLSHTAASQTKIATSHDVMPPSTSSFISPGSKEASLPIGNQTYDSTSQPFIIPSALSQPFSDSLSLREQRIAVPASRTGILQEARKRGQKKQMFCAVEKKDPSPNPELLSLVQNLDEKPKQDHPGGGFESGPEEDFLSLGAEACNFMQSPSHKFKTPPPVAPKPQVRTGELVNGSQSMPQLKGKGAELFAKRQSRMDKFVVESVPGPSSRPRTPSPSPSLPSSWKYSSNIRAPPPIAYNPLHSPFYPLAASRSRAAKAESKVKKSSSQKPRMQAIDFMRHQPYQLNSAMFCFDDSSNAATQNSPSKGTQQSNLSVTPARQVPVKTVRTYEIKRFSTPVPMPTSTTMAPTVIAPRSATTLCEPVWRTEISSPPAPSMMPASVPAQPALQETLQYTSTPNIQAVGTFSPSGSVTSPQSSMAGLQVARPRFSAARTGMQANVWRPSSVQR